MDQIITLNLRGIKRQYFQSLLIKIPYFSCLLGHSNFDKTDTCKDGSYFIDCDADFFEEIIAFLEMGNFKRTKKDYHTNYIVTQFAKFGIDYEFKSQKQVSEDMIKEFLDQINSCLNEENHEIKLDFIKICNGKGKYEYDGEQNTLKCVWDSNMNSYLYKLTTAKTLEYTWNSFMDTKVSVSPRSFRENMCVKLIKN